MDGNIEVAPEVDPQPLCRHEFVRIYQRKLKGLDRRLVATKAYLPVGFKQTDFQHLSEGSYCFCSKCRVRLFPRRTNAEKLQARLARQAEAALASGEAADLVEATEEVIDEALTEKKESQSVEVEELEIDALELEDLEEGTVESPAEEDEV